MKKKQSKFNQMFDEPVFFQENSEFVISSELYSKEESFTLFKKEIDGWGQHEEDGGSRWKPCSVDDVRDDRVRFCCQGFDDSYYKNKPVPLCAWWLGATGVGSKPVWVLEVWMRPRNLKESND